ncbi:hypothetical protein CONPUDRAFT_43446, partial [Coniophora puteana RWD-64-598 SS2]
KRQEGQGVACAIFECLTTEAADTLIRDGMVVMHRKLRPRKDRKEPIKCAKCQRWGHVAARCKAEGDTCAHCGEGHRTDKCSRGTTVRCVSCDSDTHSSSDRSCPEFLIRCAQMDARNPEGVLPYYGVQEVVT